MIKTYTNKYHQTNLYLVGNLLIKDDYTELATVQHQTKKTLQCMVSSTDEAVNKILEFMGFCCVRKCYELEVSASDLVETSEFNDESILCFTNRKTIEYMTCAYQMYQYYQKTHQPINPLTATFEQFVDILPNQVCYYMMGEEVTHLAFVEDNEIAYVYSNDLASFKQFALQLVQWLLKKYDTICFEVDNIDEVAMTLKSLFKEPTCSETYDTYIRYFNDNN